MFNAETIRDGKVDTRCSVFKYFSFLSDSKYLLSTYVENEFSKKALVLLAVRRRLCGGCAAAVAGVTADKSGHHASRCQSGKVPVSTFAARRPTLLSDPSCEQLSARLLMVLVGKVRVAQMPQHTSSVKHSDK